MAVTSSDKVLLSAALLIAIASAAIVGTLAARRPAGSMGPLPPLELADATYTPTAPDAPPIKTERWEPPVAQKRGREWIYDTFTPPEIFYNARSKQFTVRPPTSLMDDEQREEFCLLYTSPSPRD